MNIIKINKGDMMEEPRKIEIKAINLIGCEACSFYVNKKCIDEEAFMNEHGEAVCRYRPDAIKQNQLPQIKLIDVDTDPKLTVNGVVVAFVIRDGQEWFYCLLDPNRVFYTRQIKCNSKQDAIKTMCEKFGKGDLAEGEVDEANL